MARCHFVYRRPRDAYTIGDQCNETAEFARNTLSEKHRHQNLFPHTGGVTDEGNVGTEAVDNSFPRTLTDAKLRECVTEARERTSPHSIGMRGCAICGQLQVALNLTYRATRDVLQLKHLLRCIDYYD